MNVLDELKERGYFEQATYEDELRELLENEKVKFYIGFDATADSLTIGHFIQIMVMMRMQKHGHIPIVLLGGGTTMIGDPSGRNDMRTVMTKEVIEKNAEKLRRFFHGRLRYTPQCKLLPAPQNNQAGATPRHASKIGRASCRERV